MALTYTDFLSFPLQIIGITRDYNSKITNIENFITSDIAYDGTASNLTAVLPYFVFWFFCQDASTTVFAETGENSQIKEFSVPSMDKQVSNWNIGVDKLRAVCGITDTLINEQIQGTLKEKIQSILDGNGISINTNYLSKRSVL